MAANGTSAAAVFGRLARAEAELAAERQKRLKAEHQLAGTRSALSRLKMAILRQRADDALRLAALDPPPSTH
jgi:hypothetical protein